MDGSAESDSPVLLEGRRIELDPAELELLFMVCQLYRRRIPSYLQCAKPEAELIEGILKKIG